MNAFLYTLLSWLALPVILLLLALRSRKDRRYRQRWGERFGHLNKTSYLKAQAGLVVHCASVGEVEAAKPLINSLLARYPTTPITVTCTTPTGSERIQKLFAGRVTHCYLPLDTPGSVNRWLKSLQPRALLLLETELWPNLLIACRKANIQTFAVNARLSKKSARAYRRFYWFTSLILNNLDGLYTQNPATLRRFKALGFANSAGVAGNLKFDLQIDPTLPGQTLNTELKTALNNRTVWVAGSTHAGEDETLIQAFQQLSPQHPQLLLVLVPRHPERFEPVASALKTAKLSYQRFSQMQTLNPNTQVVLGDTMGDLVRWYQSADWVFVGGSLIERGGHNPIEAMIFGKPIMSGRHIFNFADLYHQLDQTKALAWTENLSQLTQQAKTWLKHPNQAKQAGLVGQQLFNQHKGATQTHLHHLSQQLGEDLRHQTLTCTKQAQILTDQRYISELNGPLLEAFNPDYWKQHNAIIGYSQGRNQAWFISHNQHTLLLRHYYRGGLIAKILKDQFLKQASIHSRAFQEFKLLTWMRAQGLPVPRACGASYRATGLTYRADILVEVIPNSQDLFTHLSQQPLQPEGWQQLGAMIAHFHQAGVYHSDLNCHNILINVCAPSQQNTKTWLIDFDKCERRQPANWQAKNLARLKRSLDKELAKNPRFHFASQNWQTLKQSYQTQRKKITPPYP
ncbi:lipid IV(A) 3-deoxy-D-manno-octulosonic acid transferase [Thiomicrospira sp. R3]|uniref:lipid IV(A) 3-deoxy-D-manno-octulosonic acid transferase n=1 Tax=Thiomicrospira sp. R3 TaxID=3035472 RepID=UPI00259BF00D|nr:lipid IV(A) 3-deoxy-D-manno-octulosonic acid transferase [Thiomicrospira sp. R3]WFE69707.1 lipid IV(A) 3-deoxy-D-manno-octulosonic acid transferase [Thiomicrospira sp. R3]